MPANENEITETCLETLLVCDLFLTIIVNKLILIIIIILSY